MTKRVWKHFQISRETHCALQTSSGSKCYFLTSMLVRARHTGSITPILYG